MPGRAGTPPADDYEPAEVMVVEQLDQLRILANPLRAAIIQEVIPAARTVAEVGEALGISPTKLYYHFRELEMAGLIRSIPVHEGQAQQRYRAVARFYQLSSRLLNANSAPETQSATVEFTIGAIDHVAAQLRRAFNEGSIARTPDVVTVQRRTARMSVAEAQQFADRLRKLASSFEKADRPDGEITVELGLALFPRPSQPAVNGDQAVHRARRFPRRQRGRSPRSRG